MSPLDQFLATQPAPDRILVAGAALLAVAVVATGRSWRLTRGFVTIAHEGGHALVAALSGRRLSGIRLHADSSGLTLTRGRPTGPGMVFTSLAGYLAPSALGLGGAALLAAGRVTALLWASLVLLPLVLVLVRNLFGLLSVLVSMAAVFAVAWYAPPTAQGVFAHLFVWFLLLGGVRPVFELQAMRRRGRAPDSDADQLAALTRVPGLFWVGVFLLCGLGAVVLAAGWLLL